MQLEAKNITKFFGKQKILENISFSLHKGKIVGLLGKNGTGKSTLIKILCGYLIPQIGNVFFNNKKIISNILDYKKIIGYLPENNPLYEELYVKEYLLQVASLYKMKKTKEKLNEIINETGLEKEQHKKVKILSKGYKQRVGLAQTLIHNPMILILDEPSIGMDPNQLIEVRILLNKIKKDKIILFSSHNLNEIKAICDRVLILSGGRIAGDMEKNFETTDLLEKVFLQFTSRENNKQDT